MKHLFLVTFLYIFVTNTYAQTVKLYFPTTPTNTNLSGTVLNKGDNFDVIVYADGNGNTTVRSLYFDFEYTNTAFQLLGVDHTGTGGNGGIGGGGGGNRGESGTAGLGGGSARNAGGNGQIVLNNGIITKAGNGGANTGSGGGGADQSGYLSYRGVGGNGGSGIVIIRYQL